MEIGTKVKVKLETEFNSSMYVLRLKNNKRVGLSRYNRVVSTDIEGRTEVVGVVVNDGFNDNNYKTITVRFLKHYDEEYGLEFIFDGELGEWIPNTHSDYTEVLYPHGKLFLYDKNEEIRDYENLIKRHTNQIENLQMDIDSWLKEIDELQEVK